MKKRRLYIIMILALALTLVTGCAGNNVSSGSSSETSSNEGASETGSEEGAAESDLDDSMEESWAEEKTHDGNAEETDLVQSAEGEKMIYAFIGDKAIKIMPEDNSSADAFIELLKTGDITVDMHDYGGFEKVGSLGTSLPTNDEQITTEPGDVILYQGNQITIYYDVNSWNFTRLGRVQDFSQSELKEILGIGNVSVRFSLSDGTNTGAHDTSDIGEVGMINFDTKTVLLNSGYEMPTIGLGTWTLNDDTAENSVYHALKCGMRLIDTARYYGNEVGVGRGLKKAIDEGVVTREDVFITSKIYGGNYERAGGIIDDALRDLDVDYIDLLLIHQPGYDDEGVYKAMEDAVNDGKLRSIGISNYYTKEQVDEVLSFATIMPAVIQNENHLYYQNTELQEYVSQYGIVIESWYPFGGRGHTAEHFDNEVIKALADKYGKTSAQVILRWQLQAGFIAIPGSSNPDHIAENYDIFDFDLTKEEMARIRALDRQTRYENW